MKPLSVVYSIRICLGVVAAAMCILLSFNNLVTGVSLGILFYLLTYYLLKRFFVAKVEAPSKILTMGIGAYFLTFALAFGLFFTLMIPTAVLSHSPEFPIMGQTVTFDATGSYDLFGGPMSYFWDFGDGANYTGGVVGYKYVDNGNYTVTLIVRNNQGYTSTSRRVVNVGNGTGT